MATQESSAMGRMVIPVKLDQSPPPHEESGDAHVTPSIVGTLGPTQVVVLGYWPIPDQSAPQQVREQFEDEARASLDAIRKPIEQQGIDIVTELSFTRDRDQLIDRVANRHGCSSVLVPGTVRTTPPESVLVLLKSDSELDRIVEALSMLFADSDVDILLFHALERGDDAESTEYMLHRVADRLTDQGISRDRIRWKQSDRGPRVDAIVSEVSNHDLVVLNESEPSVRERLFGSVQSAIADRTDRPSLTIRASR
jgi:hypothetical protein